MSNDVLLSCSSSYDTINQSLHGVGTFMNCKQSNRRHHLSSKSDNKFESTFVQNTVALAVISKLHKWCCQLFWLTIVCVIGCYGELSDNKTKTLQNVRRSIFNTSSRRCKSLTELELQLLRHLTCPQSSLHRPLRPSLHKKRQLSRMPSPQLFDISEVDEPAE